MEFKYDRSGVGIANIDFSPCEALRYKIPKGHSFSTHIHSDEVISVAVSGKMTFSDKKGSFATPPLEHYTNAASTGATRPRL